jgi:queuine tRNA-ribosyltransferase
MAVGTQAALKGISFREAQAAGCQIILGNTYHLALRPGPELIHEMGGLHQFTGWQGPMLTDSGGYQVFSLAENRKIDESGVRFRSHLDGAELHLTPEESIRIQRLVGADIIMAFDECPPSTADRITVAAAVGRTKRWLERSKEAWLTTSDAATPRGASCQALYGINQGGLFRDLREQSLSDLLEADLPGYAIGGLAVGETAEERNMVLDWVAPHLPEHKARYLMGVGTPLDLVEAVARGCDQFDCVLPTRMGRHGIAYTDAGPRHLKRAIYARDPLPIDPTTPSPASDCSRAWLRHLFKCNEALAGITTALHNLAYYMRLMQRIREAITAGTFSDFAETFRATYDPKGPADERA